MPDNETNSAKGSEPMVWLWDRKPGAAELVKVLVPGDVVPAEDLPALQRRYTPGDRVRFTYDADHPHETGTVVQDQGIYVAIDGDRPHTAFTIGKHVVQPIDPTPPSPPPLRAGAAAPAASPHDRPDVRTDADSISAYWDLGVTGDGQWRCRARLYVYYAPGYGYLAVLDAVQERRDNGVLRLQQSDVPDTVIHLRAATRRRSATGLRTTIAEARKILRELFDAGNADIVGYFTGPPLSTPATEFETTAGVGHGSGAMIGTVVPLPKRHAPDHGS